jgi:hypothetical protein
MGTSVPQNRNTVILGPAWVLPGVPLPPRTTKEEGWRKSALSVTGDVEAHVDNAGLKVLPSRTEPAHRMESQIDQKRVLTCRSARGRGRLLA